MIDNANSTGNFSELTHGDPEQKLSFLDERSDRERGFLTEKDRIYLIRQNLSGQSARRARMRIRNRVSSAYFDMLYLQYISDEDCAQIFQTTEGKINFEQGFKEFVRFTHRGFSQLDTDLTQAIHDGLLAGSKDKAVETGEIAGFDINVEVTKTNRTDIQEALDKLNNSERLTRFELAALVSNPHTEIELIDALKHEARQPNSEPFPLGYEEIDQSHLRPENYMDERNTCKIEKISEQIQSIFDKRGIDTLRDYYDEYSRLKLVNEEAADKLLSKIKHLSNATPRFDEESAMRTGLSASDYALLQDILSVPNQDTIRDRLEKKTKPPTADENWIPANDENLQYFIARIQRAREENGSFIPAGSSQVRRWNRVLEIAEFDENECSAYVHKIRVDRIEEIFRTEINSESNIVLSDLTQVNSYEELLDILDERVSNRFHYRAVLNYDEEAVMEALESLMVKHEFD